MDASKHMMKSMPMKPKPMPPKMAPGMKPKHTVKHKIGKPKHGTY